MNKITLRKADALTLRQKQEENDIRYIDLTHSNLDDVITCKLLAELGEYATLTGIQSELMMDGNFVFDLAESFLGDLPIPLPSGAAAADLSTLTALNDSLQHLAVQQQMAAFAAELEEQHQAIRRIEAGQKEDRFGEVIGARELLYMATKAENEADRASLTRSAVQQLTIATGKLQAAIQSRVQAFDAVPRNPLLMAWRMVSSPDDYTEKKDREYNELKDYVDFLRTANSLKASAYLMIDEPRLADEVYALQGSFFQTLDLTAVQSIQNMYRTLDFSEEWSFHPEHVLQADRKKLLNPSNGPVSIEITGQQLKEILDHDQNGTQKNSGK